MPVRLRWLGWAGVEIIADDQSVVIDLLGGPEGVLDGTGLTAPMPRVVPPVTAGNVAVGLCTHLHRDHADAVALAAALRPAAPVLVPLPFGGDDHENFWTLQAERELRESELSQIEVSAWSETSVAGVRSAAVPAVDAIGDPQVSWAVEIGDKRILHLGDGMFHGFWWRAAHRYGPFDAVLAPINGPVVCLCAS